MHRIAERNEFGQEVARFCFEQNIPMTVLARKCDVSYETMRAVCYGRLLGKDLMPKVRQFISEYKPKEA